MTVLTITDTSGTGDSVTTQDDTESLRDALLQMFEDAPDDVVDAVDCLIGKYWRREDIGGELEYLAITITRHES